MNISVCFTDIAHAPWVVGLRRAIPGATVSVWEPGAAPADHAVVWCPPQQFIDEQQSLQTLFNIGAGVESLLGLRLPEDIKVIRIDDSGASTQMAEYVCHTVIGYFREFSEHDADKAQHKWGYRKTKKRSDFTVGVMGVGAMGMRVVKALQMFEYPINVYSKTAKEISGVNCFSGTQGLSEFLSKTRVLINLMPLTPETEDILNQKTLSQLQPDGYVINLARGKHLVEQDLISLLDSGHLSGATLDVFRTEPLPADHPFWLHPKITITPHTAARTAREDVVRQIADKIQALQHGNSINGIVDPQKGY
jgi:glyoxylate/hydroxypyruvate reductase A